MRLAVDGLGPIYWGQFFADQIIFIEYTIFVEVIIRFPILEALLVGAGVSV